MAIIQTTIGATKDYGGNFPSINPVPVASIGPQGFTPSIGSQGFTSSTTIAGILPGSSLNQAITATKDPAAITSSTPSDTELPSYQFVAGWIFLLVLLTFANKTRIGHVIIYYSLLLIILLILVTEYQQIVPILNSIQTIGQFNAKKSV